MGIEYKNKIIAFVDILGFSAFVSQLDSNPKLHERLHWALSHIKSYKSTSMLKNTAHSNLDVSVFSDCIVISSAPDHFHDLIWAAGWLQAQLLSVGILARGGITVGKTYHSDDILYGQGMLDAYQIETSAAVYPRIVLDAKVTDLISNKFKQTFLDVDADGLWFIDPFSFPATAGDADALVEDGWDPHEVFLDELSKHIKNGIANAKRVDHLSKWTWLLRRYELAREEYRKTGETKMTLLMKLAEQKIAPDG